MNDYSRTAHQQSPLMRSIAFSDSNADTRFAPFAWGALFGFCLAVLVIC